MFSQSKFLLLISSSLCFLLFLLLIASRLILLPSFMELEEKEARANVKRVLNVLSEETESLTSLAVDYAGWDDTYRFAADVNREYIRKNLGDTFFQKFRLNFIIVVNNKGELVYHGAYDLEKRLPAPFPEGLRSLLTPGNPLLKRNYSACLFSFFERKSLTRFWCNFLKIRLFFKVPQYEGWRAPWDS